MKKINLNQHVFPHLIAVAVFLIVTVFFFKPFFFDNKQLQQHDIQEWEGSSKELREYRKATGEEGLWTNSMFSGMPAYLINVQWDNQPVSILKAILSLGLSHPYSNIFLAFLCYYILLLSFKVRPYLAIAGAVAFGLSSYMIVGLTAGHNARVGAIAFMPLVMAGVHLVFSNKKFLGFAVAATGFALHLRENHLQITYYLAFIILAYGFVQLIFAIREKQLVGWAKNVGLLVPAILIGIGTFVGPLWGITEYTAYSIRGKSELVSEGKAAPVNQGVGAKEWAFEFSNDILEPMTLLIPNFYGGATSNYLVQDEKSKTYQALVNSGDQNTANQLAQATSAYWGPQRLAVPYYAGAIIVALFFVGIGFAERKMVYWLAPIALIGIVLSWGKNFEAFNYFLFDYFPGYNKFRSVTFALIITLFALPLLGMLGVEKIMAEGLGQKGKKKLLIFGGIAVALCVLSWLLSGMLSFTREFEAQLPPWFVNALMDDRQSLFVNDVFRSLTFILSILIILYFELHKKVSPILVYAFIILMITIDLSVVNKRYLTEDNFARKRASSGAVVMTGADETVLQDKSYYRVYNLGNSLGSAFNEAHTSYFHNSIGGYHGAKLKRYQDLLDSCVYTEIGEFVRIAQSPDPDFSSLGVFNMLNTKYFIVGTGKTDIIENPAANGPAWFVSTIIEAKSPAEELAMTRRLNTKTQATIDVSKFPGVKTQADSTAQIAILEHKPNYLKYESNSASDGLAVFSEIYYEKGWKAFVDEKEVPIIRANYVLRALQVPAGKHVIEFRFSPAAYTTGNTVTAAFSWIMLLTLLGSIGLSFRDKK